MNIPSGYGEAMNVEQILIKQDFDVYCAAMTKENGYVTCLAIEKKYGLDGYHPNIVIAAMNAGIAGKDMSIEAKLQKLKQEIQDVFGIPGNTMKHNQQ